MEQELASFDHVGAARIFAESMQSVLSSDEIANVSAELQAHQDAKQYPTKATIISAIFYLRFNIETTTDRHYNKVLKSFTGNAGGISSPGGGTMFGTIFTKDIEQLYAETKSFQFNASPVMLNVNFFGNGSKFLGNFMSGGVSTVGGTGGGSGRWK
ncbi:VapA/VapB family virulence-associated protein [Paraburkholderia sp. BL21I4N1]|uniref:VapA/VapB family virulence-associated protein n=1 Tax=Paraburkholderia sp. BL21I4N1 TaxID=1938801 RepID=UPI000D44374E|nr:VapA/VapB family virulence-associated protein [Paraburkholderia sp. BL21I4N1]PQV49757.1 virulence-associated protein [Paraburkholderia sp. BL21I4N1]